MRNQFYHIMICMSFFIVACVKDKPNPEIKPLPSLNANGLLVLNEGSYSNNNAELSYIDLATKEVSNALFKKVNNKSLGDVAQSLTIINGRYYIAVNNSHKIVILDTSNFTIIHTIEQIKFPRFITQINTDIAYVSSLYLPYVYVLQLSNNTIIDTIITDFPNTEQMIALQNDVWICNWDTACNYLYKVDKLTHQLKTKVNIGTYAPHDIVQDKNGMLWVLSGNKYKSKSSSLTCINPESHLIEKSFSFQTDEDPIRLNINASKDTLYYINVNYIGGANNNGLYRMPIDDNTLPPNPMVHAPLNTYFWAFNIDPVTSHFFLSDPKGFTQSSTIYEYTSDGSLLNTFQTGIGSNQLIFR